MELAAVTNSLMASFIDIQVREHFRSLPIFQIHGAAPDGSLADSATPLQMNSHSQTTLVAIKNLREGEFTDRQPQLPQSKG